MESLLVFPTLQIQQLRKLRLSTGVMWDACFKRLGQEPRLRHTDGKVHVSTDRLHTLASLCTHTHSCIDTSKQEDTCPSSPLLGTPFPLAQAHVQLWIMRPVPKYMCV